MATIEGRIDLGGNTLIVNDILVGATGPGQAGTSLNVSDLTSVVPGTAAASKAVVLGASKEIATITTATITTLTSTTGNVTTVNSTTNNTPTVNVGASGTAGTLSVFPTTASKGKIAITATDSTGNTTSTITNAAQSAAATWTIPDTNGAASFVMTAATQTIGGAKTFSANPVLGAGTTIDLDSTTATGSSHAATVTKYAFVYTTEALTTAAGAAQAEVITLTGLVSAGDLVFVQRTGGTNTRKSFSVEAVTTSNTVTLNINNNEPTNALNGTLILNIWILKA